MTERLYAMETLDDLLVNVVDEMLKQVFKEKGTKAIYDYLESKCRLRREEIAEKPKVFSVGLEGLLDTGDREVDSREFVPEAWVEI